MPQKKYCPGDDQVLKNLQTVREAEDILKIAVKHPQKNTYGIPFDQLRDLSKEVTSIVKRHDHLSNFEEIPVDKTLWNRIDGII